MGSLGADRVDWRRQKRRKTGVRERWRGGSPTPRPAPAAGASLGLVQTRTVLAGLFLG